MAATPSQPPQLSDDARRAALAKAAAVRRARADLKVQLKAGEMSLESLIGQADGDDVIGKMKVLAVLEALPGVGKVKARRTMEEVGIADSRRMRGLGDQQRAALIAAFPHLP